MKPEVDMPFFCGLVSMTSKTRQENTLQTFLRNIESNARNILEKPDLKHLRLRLHGFILGGKVDKIKDLTFPLVTN